jgi:hypothetical protein
MHGDLDARLARIKVELETLPEEAREHTLLVIESLLQAEVNLARGQLIRNWRDPTAQ